MSNSSNSDHLGIHLNNCQFIGDVRQGSVYLLPDKKKS